MDISQYTDEELGNMSWQELLALRDQVGKDNKPAQNRLSQYENMAYAREDVAQQPERALFYVGAVPGYQLYKLLLDKGRSDPSFEKIGMGYQGVYQGLRQALAKRYGM